MSWVPRKSVKRPGFTLLEVTIAVVLIAMILVITIIAFAGTVDSSFWLRDYSQKSFLNQQAMEERITEVKHNGGDEVSYVLFGKTVEGYLVSEAMEGTAKHLKTFVIRDSAPELLLPNVDVVTNKGKPYLYLNEMTGPMDYTISGPADDLSLWYTQWFVAEPYLMGWDLNHGRMVQRDFSIPLMFHYGGGITSTEDLYPTYPNHFTGTGIVGDRLTVTEKYLGRHIVYHVQPVGHYGITGLGNQSDYIYAMGVPVLSGLKHHFDMNFVGRPDGTNLELDETLNVDKVQDLYNGGSNTRPANITISNDGSNPVKSVSKVIMELDDGKLERNQKILRLKNAHVPLGATDNVTLFMNILYEGDSSGLLFLQKQEKNSYTATRCEVGIEDSKIQMRLLTTDGLQSVYESEPLVENTMYTVSFAVTGGGADHFLRVDGIDAGELEHSDISMGQTVSSAQMGGTGDIQLTEVLVYNTALDELKFSRVERYMLNKNRADN